MRRAGILRIFIAFGLLLLLMLRFGGAWAAEMDELEQAAGDALGGVSVGSDTDLGQAVLQLVEEKSDELGGILKSGIKSVIVLLVIVLLCSLLDGVKLGTGALGTGIDAATLAAVLGILSYSVSDVSGLIGLGRQTIENMDLFSKVLLPTMAAASTAAGAPASASVRQLGTILFSDVLITVITQLLIPLTYAYIAASSAYCAIGNEGLKRIAAFIKWGITSILTVILVVFIGYLSISGAISGTADALTVRAAKLAVSSMVPVVGSIISDAAETVLAGAATLRSTIGLVGTLAILGFCFLPFVRLGVQYLAYKAAAALSSTISQGKTAQLLDSLAGAFGLVLAMTASTALLLLISIISALGVVLS